MRAGIQRLPYSTARRHAAGRSQCGSDQLGAFVETTRITRCSKLMGKSAQTESHDNATARNCAQAGEKLREIFVSYNVHQGLSLFAKSDIARQRSILLFQIFNSILLLVLIARACC
jgi:hypothetical protein